MRGLAPLAYSMDGFITALERYDEGKGTFGVCGLWSVHNGASFDFPASEDIRFDSLVVYICYLGVPVVQCCWENKGNLGKEFISISRIPSDHLLPDCLFLALVDLLHSRCPLYKISSFEQGRINYGKHFFAE